MRPRKRVVILKSPEEMAAMRRAGKIVGEILRQLPERIRPGVTTRELDAWAEKYIRSCGGQPAFKGYLGYPATLCTSINEEVVHGIPGPRVLKDGDLLSVDVGVKLDNWFGDGAWSFAVGKVSSETERLMRVTREALDLGAAQVKTGGRISDIGHAVQQHVEAAGFSVVRDYVGHGIGRALHEDPQVPNYGDKNQGMRLRPGMVLAIEPMVNAGGFEVRVLDDRWTVVTADGSRSAHFEYTVALTHEQAEVLTR